MRAATNETPAGRRVMGSDLHALLNGRTHVFVYESTPDGRRERYVEWTHFRGDGRLVYLNTVWVRDESGSERNRWSVDGPRLCILNTHFSQDEQCYTIAVTADARVQYFIDRPGDPTDRLLTKVTTETYEGPPRDAASRPAF